MKRSIAAAIGVLILVVLVLGGIYASNIKAMISAGEQMSGPMPETVEIGTSSSDTWKDTLQAVGDVAAQRGALLRAEADGRLEAILFNAGDTVEAGTRLVVMDAAVEQAQLEVAQASAELAGATLRRVRELHRREGASDAELDQAEAAAAEAAARVRSLQETIALKTLSAPFSGRLGVLRLSEGQFINRGDPIVSLQSIDRVRVDFTLPQNALSQVRPGMRIEAQVDAWPDTTFAGVLEAIDPRVNPSTRTLSLQASFDNPDGKLLPGMYVRITVVPDETREVVIAPQTAIRYATFGNAVFIVHRDEEAGLDRATQQLVRLGRTKGDFVEVLEGLEAGERIVISGVFKLRDGSYVSHSDRGTMQPELDPSPANR
jgi:membrane fusion protein (multidrug efflux system)